MRHSTHAALPRGRAGLRWPALAARCLTALLWASVGCGPGQITEQSTPSLPTDSEPAPAEPAPPELKESDWSFRAPQRPAVPEVEFAGWDSHPIDAFIFTGLSAAGLEPSAPAHPGQLLRRVTLDLTGLPPTPEELDAFAQDQTEDAYARVVEQLLARPSFGEQRAHYWLDAVRYADTHGFHFDNYRSIWPYRDYVIDAFNGNKPFDTFTIEQLAGDLLPDAGVEQRVATGFIRSGMSTNETGVSNDEYAAIYAKDRVDTLGAVWLGLTVGCAACHNHRYDPITQEDFYSLAAFFRNTTQPTLDGNQADSPPSLFVPLSLTPTLIVEEQPGEAFANVLERGRYDVPGKRVSADVPAALPPLGAGDPNNRLGLARWLVSVEQPLTARVIVNRFWAELFGTGLVASPGDFGRIGEKPSHPELLDWLAVEFRESGWDIKHLFRLMVTSAAYRQSAAVSAEALEADPDNRLLSRGPRFRMDAEMVRDLALASSGLLVERVGGPSVKPYQPPNVWEVVSLPESDTSIYQREAGEALYRRSLYTFWKRQAPPPALELFNAPDRQAAVVQRDRTNTPLQALVTMNDVQFVEAARALAARSLLAQSTTEARLDEIARRVLGRSLAAAEVAVASQLLEAQLQEFGANPAAAAELLLVGDSPAPPDLAPEELAAWTLVASTFLNLDEALSK
jgi:hypothetical protein